MWASSAKAERELGWNILPADDALRRAVEWFRSTPMSKVAIVAALEREIAPLIKDWTRIPREYAGRAIHLL